MILFQKSFQVSKYINDLKTKGNRIGFVPTMGALHHGHLSLVNASLSSNDITVCSIFINPAQFNDPSDFTKYPVTIEEDIRILHDSKTHILFLPDIHEVYPNGFNQTNYALGRLESVLEGKYRPGHFQGVCQVMQRLLEIIQPHNLYMGEKDYQQCMVVKHLLAILSSDTELHTCVTMRATNGLAMSSRNMRLSAVAKEKATAVYKALLFLKEHIKPGVTDTIIDRSRAILNDHEVKAEYIEIADALTLQPVEKWDGRQELVALVAAFVNDVRLIDNMKLNETKKL